MRLGGATGTGYGNTPAARRANALRQPAGRGYGSTPTAACIPEHGYLLLKHVLWQWVGELAAGNNSKKEPQSNAPLRPTLRYLASLFRAHHFGEPVNEKRGQQPSRENLHPTEPAQEPRVFQAVQTEVEDLPVPQLGKKSRRGCRRPPGALRIRIRRPAFLLAEIDKRHGILERVDQRVESLIIAWWRALLLKESVSVFVGRGHGSADISKAEEQEPAEG